MPETVASPLPSTIRDALAAATARLERAGCDTPRLDAELLLAESLRVDRARLYVEAREPLADRPARERFEALLSRREAREPVAYLLGRREFRRIPVGVDTRVLIPRPETELLVEVGLTVRPGARVIDVGTGSGAVALALKDERPDLSVAGSDLSLAALELARANAGSLGLDVDFLEADLLPPGTWDVVLANLPYVPTAELEGLAPEIRLYEPRSALDGGDDGLSVIPRLLSGVGGAELVAVELDSRQADAVAALLGEAGFGMVERIGDLAGHERVLVGRR